jgi:hypothetical protein
MPDYITTPTDSTTSAFATALAQALHHVDRHGHVPAEHATQLRRMIATTPREHRLSVATRLADYVGPFDGLPRQTREALVHIIREDDWWRMAGRNTGAWHFALTRLVWRAYTALPKGKRRRLLGHLGGMIQNGPSYGVYTAYQQRLRWQARSLARPPLQAMLHLAEIAPWHFAVGYARGIPQLPPCRALWHDPARQHTIGVMLGIDLLPTPQGWYFIESNLDSALRLERTALYDRDPFVANLLTFVKAHGYRHLIIMGNSADYDALMVQQYHEGAAAAKLKLTILEDAYLPKKHQRQGYYVPRLEDDGTLVMRIKYYRTSLDGLFQHKRASRRALEVYQRHANDPAICLVPTELVPVLGEVALDEPFPNLVYKLPEIDSAGGVMLMKATSPEHARVVLRDAVRQYQAKSRFVSLKRRLVRADDAGICQPYLRGALLPGRRLYIVRAHVLLTPIGTHFLSAHRVVAGRAVPEHLPPGLVQDPKPYLVNYSAGAHYAIVPPEEEPAVVKTALAIANGLAWAAAYGFQTGSAPETANIVR